MSKIDFNDIKSHLINYITEQTKLTDEIYSKIYKFCSEQKPISLALYRGQIDSKDFFSCNNKSVCWYSSSKSKNVAQHEFSDGNCCVIKINIIDVPVIDINKFLSASEIKDYKDEEEVLFLGG